MCYSIDNSSPEELIDSLNPMNNGLQFAPRCNGRCFLPETECDHTLQKATLNHVGEYVVFPSMWYHHGYFSITPRKTVIQVQLFGMHSPNPTKERLTRLNTNMNSIIKGRIDTPSLNTLTKDLVANWNTTYSDKSFPACSYFDGEPVDKDKNRHIYSNKFNDVPRIRGLVQIFEAKFKHLCVDSVWILKKMSSNDGFQGWHRDFALGNKITTTIVVNVGCIEDDIMNDNTTCGMEKPPEIIGATVDATVQDPVGISVRKGRSLELIQRCKYCKNGIPKNRWRVICVKRKGKEYNVKHIHIFHAKLTLSDDEFQFLQKLLKSSSDPEIKQLRSAWIQSMHQGMGKGVETGAKRRSSLEWFKSVNKK